MRQNHSLIFCICARATAASAAVVAPQLSGAHQLREPRAARASLVGCLNFVCLYCVCIAPRVFTVLFVVCADDMSDMMLMTITTISIDLHRSLIVINGRASIIICARVRRLCSLSNHFPRICTLPSCVYVCVGVWVKVIHDGNNGKEWWRSESKRLSLVDDGWKNGKYLMCNDRFTSHRRWPTMRLSLRRDHRIDSNG